MSDEPRPSCIPARWTDPPDPPHGAWDSTCENCGEVVGYQALREVNGVYTCAACVEEDMDSATAWAAWLVADERYAAAVRSLRAVINGGITHAPERAAMKEAAAAEDVAWLARVAADEMLARADSLRAAQEQEAEDGEF